MIEAQLARLANCRTHLFVAVAVVALVFAAAADGAQVSQGVITPVVNLGTAGNFAVLAGSTVTNTGATVVNGNVGVSTGSAVTGFPPGVVVGGSIHSNDAAAIQAQTDLTTAYNAAAGAACTGNLTGQDLGGKTLTAGVYCFDSSAQLTGTLILDAQGNPNAQFIFKIGSTLTTASASNVIVVNGGSTCNVFWQVGSSAVLGTTTSFGGNILALASITMNTGANLSGRALARTGAVTLDTNAVTACAAGVVAGGGIPALSGWLLLLLAAAIAAVALVMLRR
ncbi:MAG TPA: ice-binding family protein [Thermoanaerobaculia bacterium]